MSLKLGSAQAGVRPQLKQVGGELMVYASADAGASWKGPLALTHGSRHNHGYVRTPLNARARFQLFWCDGNPQYSTASYLYFGSVHGEVFRLPYRMSGPTAPVESY